jgi:uncharacterized DUF497 family protein
MALTFEWDARKAAANLARHGVSFDEAITVSPIHLAASRMMIAISVSEVRLVLLGTSSADRLLAVMFTERGPGRIRVISARPATRSERRQYEESRK